MADKLWVNISIDFVKGNTSRSIAPATIKPTISLTPSIDNVQSVGTSYEAAQLGDITDLGYIYLENLDGQYIVEVSAENVGTNKLIELAPGEFAFFKSSPDTIYLKATTQAVNVRVVGFSR